MPLQNSPAPAAISWIRWFTYITFTDCRTFSSPKKKKVAQSSRRSMARCVGSPCKRITEKRKRSCEHNPRNQWPHVQPYMGASADARCRNGLQETSTGSRQGRPWKTEGADCRYSAGYSRSGRGQTTASVHGCRAFHPWGIHLQSMVQGSVFISRQAQEGTGSTCSGLSIHSRWISFNPILWFITIRVSKLCWHWNFNHLKMHIYFVPEL